MNRAELIEGLVKDCGLTKVKADKVIESLLGRITYSVARGRPVKLVGFGTFLIKTRKERVSFNPYTKKNMITPATKFVKFRPSSVWKEIL